MWKDSLNFHLLISKESRQEYLTTVTFAVITVVQLLFIGVVTIYHFATGDESGYPYFLTAAAIFAVGWYLSDRGWWRWTRRVPALLFFGLGVYGSLESDFSTFFVIFYIIAFMLSGLLINKYEMFLTAFLAIVIHAILTWPSFRLEWAIVLAAQFVGIGTLQLIYITIADNVFAHSLRDPLTQVYNRSYFDATLTVLHRKRAYPITILVADIDGLKKVNDSFGHSFGDTLLIRAARCLRMGCCSTDNVCRIGGDEFAIILTQTDEPGAFEVRTKIMQQIEADNQEYPEMPLRFSIGVATAMQPDHLVETFQVADARMYTEKIQNRSIPVKQS
jgi:diguanylate cyclase (GGDEF)-like protein